MHDINKATENSHVKSNLFDMLHHIQKVGQLPLLEFKDILTAEDMEQAKLEINKPDKKTWIPIPRSKFLEYIHSVSKITFIPWGVYCRLFRKPHELKNRERFIPFG
jgi:hypothetical protein